MKRILFVDDNALMRDLYAAMLSDEGGRWEVATAESGEAALNLMAQRPFDVVASDMRMDGMSGIELLKAVERDYPQTSRIIISGLTDQGTAADALGSTHQFLAKPVEYKTLNSVIERITGLDRFLKDEKLKKLAGRLRVLPSFPVLYLEIMKAIEDPNSSMEEIQFLISKDPGLTAKILQVANSAAAGARARISDPFVAVQQMGLKMVRSLALSAHVFASFTAAQRINFPVDALWEHLMKCAETARSIMLAEGAEAAQAEAAYTAGMLHDIGKLMLADSLPKEFQKALTLATTRETPFYEIEGEVFGATHAGLAAYLLGLWGLPAPIVEAVAFHHTPERSSVREFGPLTAVHAANALEHEVDGDHSLLNKDYLAGLRLGNRVDAWRRMVVR